jgi:rhamnogalacturonyl hydrolase YesR
MIDHLTSRAQRLIEEFEEGETVRHGIANVLTHLANTWDHYSDGDEYWHGVTTDTLEDLIIELTAPTLMERALAGDRKAARQFLQELGMIDTNGQLTAPYRPEDLND